MKTLIVILALLATIAVAGDKAEPTLSAQQEVVINNLVSEARSKLGPVIANDNATEPAVIIMAREVYLRTLVNYREQQAGNRAFQAACDKEIEAVRKLAVGNPSKAGQRAVALIPGIWRVKCSEWNKGKSIDFRFFPDGRIAPAETVRLKIGDEDPDRHRGDWVLKEEVLSIAMGAPPMEISLSKVSENFSIFVKERKFTVYFTKQKD